MVDEEFDRLTPEEKKERFQKAVDNYYAGYIEEDYAVKSLASTYVQDALEDNGRVLEEFKPSQRKIIYEAAEANLNIDYLMNPKFSASHMKFISEQLQQGKNVTWLPVGKYHENIVRKPLTKAEITSIRERMEKAGTKDSVINDLNQKKKEVAKIPIKKENTNRRGER